MFDLVVFCTLIYLRVLIILSRSNKGLGPYIERARGKHTDILYFDLVKKELSKISQSLEVSNQDFIKYLVFSKYSKVKTNIFSYYVLRNFSPSPNSTLYIILCIYFNNTKINCWSIFAALFFPIVFFSFLAT